MTSSTLLRRRPLTALLAAFAVAFFAIPLLALLVRAPWSSLPENLGTAEARDALRLSLVTSCSAAALSVVFGLPLAWCLARVEFPGRSLVRGLVLLPLVLPPVVGGVALLGAFSRQGLVGARLYDLFGFQLTFTTAGAVMAETFVALPFFVITVEAGLRSMDRRTEEIAATLGADPRTVFRRVTLPAIAPSLVAGTVLAWARALGEFGATVTFAGNIVGRTQTLPLAVYLLRNYMVGLPRDIIENAKVDGATDFQIFTKLILPLSFPALASFAIFQFLWTWNDLLVAKVFLIDATGETTVMTNQIVELLGTRGGNWEILATAAFVSIAVPLVVFFAMQRYLVRGLLAGSVK